jgi:SAM-dependent methyltransferase
MKDEVTIQREYYERTADQYNARHVQGEGPHDLAVAFLIGAVRWLGVKSVLDLGCGTGRTLLALRKAGIDIRMVGVEPVFALRELAYGSGLAEDQVVDGDATALKYAADEFDLVCAFGALHHIRDSSRAVGEMLRIARRAVFISDGNNFGHGSRVVRAAKQMLNACGLWKAATYVRTKGKGYSVSEGDGVTYSYSVFNSFGMVQRECSAVHVLNTSDGGVNPYRTASHVALLGVKRAQAEQESAGLDSTR